jgi:hypothetical protein
MFKNYSPRLLIYSNAIALIAWISLFFEDIYSVGTMILCFITLLMIDIKLYKQGIYDRWFIKLRSMATFLVTLSLVSFLFSA